MPFKDTNRTLYNIVLVTEPPCGGEPYRYSEIVNHQPEEWARAVKWIHGIMRMIGKADGSRPMYAVDAYLEPADCPRPWTPELKAVFQREALRGNPAPGWMLDRERARGEFLHAALCQMIGTKAADAVREGRQI